jgi:5'-nucleotidase
MQPLLLVTNDDGVHAPGIRALADALVSLGEVHVVAPDREVSACSQSLTLKHPLRAERIGDRIHTVDGTPADCVALGTCAWEKVELVLSGINIGTNLGNAIWQF